jgi:hypothetical protein
MLILVSHTGSTGNNKHLTEDYYCYYEAFIVKLVQVYKPVNRA